MRIIQDLETTRDETLGYFDLSDDALDRDYGPGKWSVRYILHHLSDSETVFFDRIRRVLSGPPRPVIWNVDQDAWAKALDYSRVPLALSRPIFESVRNGVIHYARVHYEESGHLDFVHSSMGLRTLRDEFDKIAAHNTKHLEHIRAALGAQAGKVSRSR